MRVSPVAHPDSGPVPFHPMTVAGVMSGTSADGIDVALVEIHPVRDQLKLKLAGHRAFPFTAALRQAVLSAMDAKSTCTAELARLNWRLGQAYAEAVRATVARHPVNLQLIGCHGQTIYHQAVPAMYAGRKVACTWQIGEPALLAAELGFPLSATSPGHCRRRPRSACAIARLCPVRRRGAGRSAEHWRYRQPDVDTSCIENGSGACFSTPARETWWSMR